MPERWPDWLDEEQAELQRQAYHEHLGRVAQRLREEIESEGVSDTGRLLKSIQIDEEQGTVVMTTSYADFVEEGRSPGSMPPYDAIRRWVRRKLGVRGTRETHDVTWAIMLKIKKRGIPGKHLIERAWKRALQ
jgi:hypothetical protein